MTYIVNESCIRCKLMDCVEVCPVDCFYEGENMLVIHPDECIDRIVVPETRELGQLVRMLEERGAEAIPCPMIGIRDAPDAEPVAAWLHWFVKGSVTILC